MKPNVIVSIIFFSFYLGTSSAQSQEPKPLYVSLSFIKINPGKASTYFNLIKNYSPRITESRISQNAGVLGWYMYEVIMPSGAANDYDLVSITLVDDLNLLFDELSPSEDTMHKIMPGMSDQTINDIFEQYESSRTVIKKEVYVLLSDAVADNPASKYLSVDYLQSNSNIVIHTNHHALLKKMMPYDTRVLYNQVRTYSSNTLSAFVNASNPQENSKVKITATDKIIFNEVWKLVEYVDWNKIKK